MQVDFSMESRANKCIAQGALTNSKRPASHVYGFYPTHLIRGWGSNVEDISHNVYLDYICGLGTNLLGYGEESICSAVYRAIQNGQCLSLSSTFEVSLAEKLKEIFPFMHRMRFLKTGSEAALAALRIARTFTGRTKVLSKGYHGWGDEFVSLQSPAYGVYDEWFDIETFRDNLEQITPKVAALIIEPIGVIHNEKEIEKLWAIKDKCEQTGTILIFDEIITGFRWPKFSVSTFYNISPDIILLGKAIANGMPLAVVGGDARIMDCGEYFVSSTYAGDRGSLAAAYQVINLLQSKKKLEYLWAQGQDFIDKFNNITKGTVTLVGYPTRAVFQGSTINKALFFQEAIKAGLLFGPSWFFNFDHIEKSESTLLAIQDIFYKINNQMVVLEGKLPVAPFSQKVRNE